MRVGRVGAGVEQHRSPASVPSRRRPGAVWVAVAVVALLIAAACGDDDDDATATTTTAAGAATTTAGAGATTTTELEPVDPLKVTIGGTVEQYAATWIALGDDIFQKHGVEVEVTNFDGVAAGLAQLAADQIDLFFFTPALGLNLANNGVEISYIYRFSDLDFRYGAFATIPSIHSFDELKAMGSGCRLAAPSVGTSLYALALAFQKAYGLTCEIVPQASGNLQIPSLASGEVQAAVAIPTMAYTAEQSGVVNILHDPRTVSEADGEKVFADRYPHMIVFGKKAVLEEKREAVVRFVSALQEASGVLASSTPEQLTQIALKVETFATTDPVLSAETWKIVKTQVPTGPDPGRISEDEWNKTLQGLVTWGVEGLDPADPDISYDAVVDMSYFDEAAERG